MPFAYLIDRSPHLPYSLRDLLSFTLAFDLFGLDGPGSHLPFPGMPTSIIGHWDSSSLAFILSGSPCLTLLELGS